MEPIFRKLLHRKPISQFGAEWIFYFACLSKSTSFWDFVFSADKVYQQSIAAVCQLDWPKSKMLIQILDDSDDPVAQTLIKEEFHRWQQEGANILDRHRVLREGYKAGNLTSAMSCSYVKDYEFVDIFDAVCQPEPDFLNRMENKQRTRFVIPFNEDNIDLYFAHKVFYQPL